MAKGTTIEKLFLSLGLDMTQLDADLLTASKTVNEGMSDLNRKAQQAKLKMDIDLSRFPDAEKSVEALIIKEKALSAQHDIQKQKVALMNAAYTESVATKGKDDIASQKLLTRLLREQKAEADLTAQIKKTNAARLGLSGSDGNVNTGTTNAATAALNTLAGAMGSVKNAGQSAGNGVMFLNNKMLAVAAIAASGAGLFDLVKGAVAAGDATYKLSNRLNLTAAEAGNLNRILKMSDVDAQPFISTMIRLDKAVTTAGKNGNAATNAMELFGFSLVDGEKNLLPMNEQLEQLAKGYENAAKAGMEEEFTADVLGAKGAALVGMLKDYKINAEAASRVTTLGLDPQQMHEMAVEMKVLDLEAGQMKNVLGMALVPLAKEIIPDIISGFDSAIGTIKENKEEIANSVKITIELVSIVRELGAELLKIPKFELDLMGIHSAKDVLRELKVEFEMLKKHSVIDIVANNLATKVPVLKNYVPNYRQQAQEQIESDKLIIAENKKKLDEERKIADEEKRIEQEKANAIIQAKMKQKAAAEANRKANLELAAEVYKANHSALENELHEIDLRSQKLIDDGVTESVAAEISATRKKMIIDKNNEEIRKSSEELSIALYKIGHSALENRLVDIEKERQEWIKKTHDEVAATQLAEKEKQKAVKDTINSQYSEEVRAVKAAIIAGTSLSDAYNEAHKKTLLDRDAQAQAERYAANKNGVYMPGDTKRTTIIDGNSAYQKEDIVMNLTFDESKLPTDLLSLPEKFGDSTQKAIENAIKSIPEQIGVVSQADANSRSNSQSATGAGREIQLNMSNSIEIKGFTADEIKKAVEQGAEQTGKQIYDALQDANAMMGM